MRVRVSLTLSIANPAIASMLTSGCASAMAAWRDIGRFRETYGDTGRYRERLRLRERDGRMERGAALAALVPRVRACLQQRRDPRHLGSVELALAVEAALDRSDQVVGDLLVAPLR